MPRELERVAGVVAIQVKGETRIAPSTPTASIAATISSPVTCVCGAFRIAVPGTARMVVRRRGPGNR